MSFMLGADLRGKRLGVVGLGNIGTRVAARARAFGMSVAYHGRRPAPAQLVAELEAERLSLDELLASADVLSLHCPLTAETRRLIGVRELKLMKPTATLINTARGPVVDERALAEALRERRIAAAGLDVYEHEPAVEPGLLKLESSPRTSVRPRWRRGRRWPSWRRATRSPPSGGRPFPPPWSRSRLGRWVSRRLRRRRSRSRTGSGCRTWSGSSRSPRTGR
jgi:hypothetical protein